MKNTVSDNPALQRSLMSMLSEKAPKNSVNLSIGEPTYPTPNILIKKINELVSEDSADYGPVAGLINFRNFIADIYSKMSIKHRVDSKNVLATCGVTEAIYISLSVLIDENSEVIYPDPGFVLYEQAIRLCGGKPVPMKLDRNNNFSFNPDLLRKIITAKTKVLIINSPSNPTGTIIPKNILSEIADICDENNIKIISDEIYEHHVYEGSHHSIAEFSDNVIICSGTSKLFRLAGWRLGWCVANEKLINELIIRHQYITFRAPTISQKVAQAALSLGDEIESMVRHYKKKRDIMATLLMDISGVSIVESQATFFIYADFSKYDSDWNLALKFLKNGVVTVPSTGPGAGFGQNGKGFIRLSYAADEKSIRSGVDNIKKVLRLS